MDIISFNEAATANGRIERFIENPDSNSGVLTQPKVIEAGETVTIKSGRQAILADTVVDGDLVIEAGGDVFVPAGAGFGDLDQRIDTKLDKDFSSFADKSTPDDTDNLALQEVGGDLKKVSFQNLTKLSPNDSRVKTALNASGTAPIYACRAWVNFNGTGTVAIRASGNVSSITDNGTGDYTVNFLTAMPDANYSESLGNTVYGVTNNTVNFCVKGGAADGVPALKTTTQLGVVFQAVNDIGSKLDLQNACLSIFR